MFIYLFALFVHSPLLVVPCLNSTMTVSNTVLLTYSPYVLRYTYLLFPTTDICRLRVVYVKKGFVVGCANLFM